MGEKIFCIEITGEGLYHNCLNWSGISGKAYRFFRNYGSASYLRAYRSFDDYLEERHDLHVPNGVWALKANFIPAEKISKECYTTTEPTPVKIPVEEQLESETEETQDAKETPTKRRPGRPNKLP